MISLGFKFSLSCGSIGKVTEVFANGFHYHTLNENGDCILGQRYMTKSYFIFNINKLTGAH